MKCGIYFSKGPLNVCPVKEKLCNIFKYKGHFGRLCKSKGRRPVVNNVEEKINNQKCPCSSVDSQVISEEIFCGVINAWTEEGKSGNDDYSVLKKRIVHDDNGPETKKIVNIGLKEAATVNMNNQLDSAVP